MAYLNMRERRVEATILYVGAVGAGRATNVARLHALASSASPMEPSTIDGLGDVLQMEWLAPTPLEFRDCTLLVRVIAARGDISSERARALVRPADGVVLVTDLRPEAREDNKAMARLLQEAVVETKNGGVPVVVQANKTDLPDALDAAEIAGDLGEPWPCIPASAARGEGVLETIERALAEVLARLQSAEQPSTTPVPLAPTTRATSPRAEGNPLLSALRQVLRDTVEEHVALLEARFLEKLVEAQAAEVSAISELSRGLASQACSLSTVERLLQERQAAERVVAPGLKKLASDSAASFAQMEDHLDRVSAGLRGAMGDVLEARGRSDRDHVAAAVAPVRQAVENLAADVRTAEILPRLGAIREAVAALASELEAVSDRTRKVEALAAATSATLKTALGPQLTRVEDLVRESGVRAAGAALRTDQSVAELSARTGELFEELARRGEKKGWFR